MNTKLIAAVIISSLSAMAYAGDDRKETRKDGQSHHQSMKQFSSIDTNKDKKLSKAEVLSFHEKRFVEIDADKDGLITKKEIKAHGKKQRFMRIDTNKDGVISEEEHAAFEKHGKRSHGKNEGNHKGKYEGKHKGKHDSKAEQE